MSQSNATQSKDLFLLISLQQVWVSPRSHCSTSHDYTTSPAKTKRLTFYSFIPPPISPELRLTVAQRDRAKAVSCGQAVTAIISSINTQVTAGSHAEMLPETFRLWTLRDGEWEWDSVSLKWSTQQHHQPGNEPAGWFLFTQFFSLSFTEHWWSKRQIPSSGWCLLHFHSSFGILLGCFYVFKTNRCCMLVTFAKWSKLLHANLLKQQ